MTLHTFYAQDFNRKLEGMTLEEKKSHIERKMNEIKEEWALLEDMGQVTDHMPMVYRDLQEMQENNIQARWIAKTK